MGEEEFPDCDLEVVNNKQLTFRKASNTGFQGRRNVDMSVSVVVPHSHEWC